MPEKGNKYLDRDASEESDLEEGYDSEAAEVSKGSRTAPTGRSNKRRKLSHSDDDDDDEEVITATPASKSDRFNTNAFSDEEPDEDDIGDTSPHTHEQDLEHTTTKALPPPTDSSDRPPTTSHKPKSRSFKDPPKPGVIYLSSLPPYLKPSALRNLLTQRGFTPITRLFLTPASKAKSSSKKNSRQLYTEGWIEFGSKKTAKRCAEALNAQIIGGKKGGFYYDDIWNMKYLRGMGWGELMAGVREERREEEGRRDEERRVIAKETKRFVEGVEEGRKVEGMKRKRLGKEKERTDGDGGDGGGGAAGNARDIKRTWRQFEVKGKNNAGHKQDKISDDAREVLGQIF